MKSTIALTLWLGQLLPLGRAQTIDAPDVEVCAGDELRAVSQGCMTAADCEAAAQAMGLKIGSAEWPFEGNWADKGCIYYPSDHPLYPNEAYFGTEGTCSQLKLTPMADAIRLSCDGSTRPPFDPERCQGDDLCRSAAECEAAALANGLSIGGFDPFEGEYHVKGCIFYPLDHPDYPGEAYWGTGASICGQLRADPKAYDGSVRMTCGAGVGGGGASSTADNIPDEGEADGEESFTTPPAVDLGDDDEEPVTFPPRPTANTTTAPRPTVPQPTVNATQEDTDDGLDEEGTVEPFEVTGPSVSRLEGQQVESGAVSSGSVLGMVTAIAALWAMN